MTITAWRRSLRNLPCFQLKTMGSWSLLCNASDLSFPSSAGIPLTPAAWPLLNCSMALVISFTEGSSSNSALNGCWGIRRTAGSLTTRSAVKRGWKCSTQNGGLICKKHLPIHIVQETLDPVSRAIYYLESFIEASVVT